MLHYSASHITVVTWERFRLNFVIFLTILCWLLFELDNQNMGNSQHSEYWIWHFRPRQFQCFDWPIHSETSAARRAAGAKPHTYRSWTNQNKKKTCIKIGNPYGCLFFMVFLVSGIWHLSKQGIRWPVSHDHIAGPSAELIEITCFFTFNRWPCYGFSSDGGLRYFHKLLEQAKNSALCFSPWLNLYTIEANKSCQKVFKKMSKLFSKTFSNSNSTVRSTVTRLAYCCTSVSLISTPVCPVSDVVDLFF